MRFVVFVAIFILLSCTSKIAPHSSPPYNDAVNQQLWTVEWSPDSKFIAVGGVDSTLRIYHAKNLKLHKAVFIPSWIHVVKWNPDGKLIAIATSTAYVYFYDLA